jgi:hypothetical protein
MDLELLINENRIELLKSRDPVMNARIIRKLERKRKLLLDKKAKAEATK